MIVYQSETPRYQITNILHTLSSIIQIDDKINYIFQAQCYNYKNIFGVLLMNGKNHLSII